MTTFAHFSDDRFPNEIKDLIWEYAMAAIPPRTLPMKLRSITTTSPSHLSSTSQAAYYTPLPIPTLLRVSSDSRLNASKRWALAFQTPDQKGGIRVDFQSDMLSFQPDQVLLPSPAYYQVPQMSILQFRLLFSDSDRKLLQRIQLDWTDFLTNRALRANAIRLGNSKGSAGEEEGWHDRVEFVMRTFPGVKVLKLVGEIAHVIDTTGWGAEWLSPFHTYMALRWRLENDMGGRVEGVMKEWE